jgi:predicted transcriptional regulator
MGFKTRRFINLLQTIKDSGSESDDWGKTLSEEEKAGIIRGLGDIKKGRIVTHEDVRAKYGL